MTDSLPDMSAIEEEVYRRFEPSNPITEAIAAKLVDALHQQRRCESLIEFARTIPAHKLDAMPAHKRTTFERNVRQLLERMRDLNRTTREYSTALQSQTEI